MVDSSWFVLADVKAELEIATADTADDSLLNDYGSRVNRIIDNKIFPFKDIIPEVATLEEDLKDCAIAWCSYKYKRKNEEFDSAREYKVEFDDIIDSVITRLIASNELRTRRVIVSKAYATQPMQDDPTGPS